MSHSNDHNYASSNSGRPPTSTINPYANTSNHLKANNAAAYRSSNPPPPPPVQTAPTAPTAVNPSMNNQGIQTADLQAQLQALRQELMSQSEANFELNATIATMQAEMTHTIQSSETKHKEETSKLNHLLRLEQKKSQQLEQHQQPQRKRGASTDSVFSRRLASAVPRNITTNDRSPPVSNHCPPNPPPEPTLSSPIVPPAQTTTIGSSGRRDGAGRLAQQLLQSCTTILSNTVRQLLVDIASDDHLWNEVQVVEFLIRQDATKVCCEALRRSRAGRMSIVRAIEPTLASTTPSSRIQRLGGEGDSNEGPYIDEFSLAIFNALQDPWWDSPTAPDLRHEKPPSIPTELVRSWLSRLPTNQQLDGLRALHLVLEECNDDHSQTEWWHLCHSTMERVLEQTYLLFLQITAASSSDEALIPIRVRNPKVRRRRIEASNGSNNVDLTIADGSVNDFLAVSLSIFSNLLQTTHNQLLTQWYKEGNGARMVSLVLDLLAEHYHVNATKKATIGDKEGLEGWYMDALHFLSVVGTTPAGMVVLRTRTRPTKDNDGDSVWMGNALDVSIRHLFSLVMDQEEEYTTNTTPDQRRIRTLAIEGWIRLWHQVLLFIQQQQQPDKQPVSLAFRSLVLDHQDWYTSACAMLLANESTRPEIKSMIRLQLEELSMDEEEHDELKGN